MLETICNLLWGAGTLAFLLGTGAFLTVRTGFLPWRKLGYALRLTLGRSAHQSGGSGISPFAALMTALAATVGTGNIVGVAAALTAGGPGALLWMEVSALLGLSLKFGESMLAVKYRRRAADGRWFGGPMVVMDAALGQAGTFLGCIYALAAAAASLAIGSAAQSNAISQALCGIPGLSPRAVGIVTALAALPMIFGGIRGISAASTLLVPVMGFFYISAGIAVILGNLAALPGSLQLIFREAFSIRAAAGGAAGTVMANALRIGAARGIFSNEAGLGSAGIAAAAAEAVSPVQQGYIAMAGTVFDTFLVCTVTGLAICCSGALSSGADGAALTILAFRTVLGDLGTGVICVSLTLFAFSSILGWAYQGESALMFLTEGRLRPLYRLVFLAAVCWGAKAEMGTVLQLADVCSALMCLPNLVCLLSLSGEICREMRRFQWKRSPGRL